MGSPHLVTGRPRAALIGGGFIAPVHAEALRRIGVEVVGILGSAPERARAVAQRLGIGRVYHDLDELLADPGVEAVHVASPNAHHFEQASRVLESGRHLVCEKPLALNSNETGRLRNLAESRPRQLAAVNYNVRFYPLCLEMRDRVARGDIGQVLSVTGSYTQDWLLYPTDYNWRVEADGQANLRAVADIGTHWMDLAQFVCGRPIEAVCADLATFHKERWRPAGPAETFTGPAETAGRVLTDVTTDDHAAVLLRMGEGVRGAFHVSQVQAGRKNRLLLEVAGTEGSFAWDSELPNQLWIGRRAGPNQVLERDPALLGAEAAEACHYPGGHAEGFADTFKQLFLAVYGAVGLPATSAGSYPTLADGDREVRLCEAIARSAAGECWVAVSV
jgi:predicted dehydrogenase